MDNKSSNKADGDSQMNSSSSDSKKDSRFSSKDYGRRRDRDRDRNRNRRRSRSPVRSREDRISKVNKRVYVANIPFDVKWGELKDLFREKVGNVRFCQLFDNEDGRPRGCGLVEFEDSASAKKAVDVLNRYEFKGRNLVVKEDLDIDRDDYGRLVLPSSRRRDDNHDRHSHYDDHYQNGSSQASNSYNTYGLSPQFLSSLGVTGPLNNRVFVANLDYKVTERKLKDIFVLAGKVVRVKLYCDSDGKSKGFGIVEFEHPVEAVQAISMFNNQVLYERILSVRLDKFDEEDGLGGDAMLPKLPKGLESIGKGLGIGGQPLNLSKSMMTNPPPPMSSLGTVQPPPVAQVPIPTDNVAPQTASAALSALTNLAGNLQNLPSLAQSLAQLSNTAGIANSATAYQASSEIPPTPVVPTYSGYSPVAPPGNGTAQPPPYPSTPMAPSNSYCAPTVGSSTPYGTPVANVNPPMNYSSYDQRDYRDDKYHNPGIDTIFVRNLPPSFTWQNLRDRFNEVGEVRFAEIKGHGTALVRLASDRDAQRAVELMNGIRIDNRAIEVSLYY